MNMALKLSRLPATAVQYAFEMLWLARGLRAPLGRWLAREDINSWTVTEEGVSDEALLTYETGYLQHVPGPMVDWVPSLVGQRVAYAMRMAAPAVWIVPDPLGNASDPFVQRSDVPRVTAENVPYYVATSGEADEVSRLWQQAGSAAGQIGVCARLAEPTNGESADVLASVEHAVMLALSAYDGEGVMFFELASDSFFESCSTSVP